MSVVQKPEVMILVKPVWNEYRQAWEIGSFDGKPVFVLPFIFTTAIITADGPGSYDNRWCYGRDAREAILAARTWLEQGAPEPEGWHRHIPSGRRREGGDPATECIWH